MGTSILKGITAGLLVTVLTLVAVLGATLAGIDKSVIAYVIDFGLLLSCLTAGYRASSHTGRILPGGLAAGGYAVVGILLLALYFSIDILGAVKIISEGTGLGFLAGVLGAGVLSAEAEYRRVPAGFYLPREPIPLRTDNYYERRNEPYDPGHRRQDEARGKILELCRRSPEKTEEDDAFDWWRVEAQRQLKNR